jgi:hypothetical protein
MFFLLFLLHDIRIRIREAQKHMDLAYSLKNKLMKVVVALDILFIFPYFFPSRPE